MKEVFAPGSGAFFFCPRKENCVKTHSAKIITRIGILAALASVLYYFPEIAIIPPIYKLDFSTLPALLGGYAIAPWAGVLIVLIKDLIGLLHSSTMGVGELADFLMSGSFVLVASLVYMKSRNFKGAMVGSLLGIVAMVLLSAVANYYIMIPFYIKVMEFPEEAIVGLIAKTIPSVTSLGKLILFATMPFNLLKGVILAALNLVLYRYLKRFLHVEAGNA